MPFIFALIELIRELLWQQPKPYSPISINKDEWSYVPIKGQYICIYIYIYLTSTKESNTRT
uniref:Uncharacterized protein n=1 Tax=Rhizophora mucronata TaxID=61149 RepID=A0A2P2Q060_RHIMU